MNPLSDIGMPDNFWKKYQRICSKIEGLHPKCQCGSGLPITVNHIPLWTKKGIIWVTNSFLTCLACATRLLWKVKSSADEDICGYCGEPGADKMALWTGGGLYWPGEYVPETELVHSE